MSVKCKFLIVLLFCFLNSVSNPLLAQVEKGRLRLGGSLSASLRKSSTEYKNAYTYTYDADYSSVSLTPVGGIFLMDGLELGISPSFTWDKQSSEVSAPLSSSSESKSTNFLIGPYANYYIGQGERGKPFIGVSPKIGWGSGKSDVFDSETGTTQRAKTSKKVLTFGMTAGYAIFLNDSYLLSFFAGYEYSTHKNEVEELEFEAEDKINMFTLGVSISTTFKK